ncbi:MAG: low molecular weight protein-tyrosine-phosphatase [Rikenellaceae bacterium]
MKQKILFVCLGNICRSPAADGLLHALAAERGLSDALEIDSAGTYAGHAGELPDARMRSAAARRGYSLTHRSRPVDMDDFFHFDRIIAMDDNNLENLRRMAPSPQAEAKIERFAALCKSYEDVHYIPDPYYGGRDGFDHVLDLLEDGCRTILDAYEGQ